MQVLRQTELVEEQVADAPERSGPVVVPIQSPTLKPYPRWAVVSGVAVYCALCWVVIWAAGGWLLGLISDTLRTP